MKRNVTEERDYHWCIRCIRTEQVSEKLNKGLTKSCHNDDLAESHEQNFSDEIKLTENGITYKGISDKEKQFWKLKEPCI